MYIFKHFVLRDDSDSICLCLLEVSAGLSGLLVLKRIILFYVLVTLLHFQKNISCRGHNLPFSLHPFSFKKSYAVSQPVSAWSSFRKPLHVMPCLKKKRRKNLLKFHFSDFQTQTPNTINYLNSKKTLPRNYCKTCRYIQGFLDL